MFWNFVPAQTVFVPPPATLALEASIKKRIVFRQTDERLSVAL
jgi:hypothetical protein